jgi:eukaryotic-like serine/threonine-protein kinase
MNATSDQRNPVEVLAEEFLDRKRRGEKPTLDEYIDRHPELASEIREIFPAFLMVEDLGDNAVNGLGLACGANDVTTGLRLRQLGDYRIVREIGRGGMGVVYEAEQESLNRRVALKVLAASALVDDKQVRRFGREAKAAAQLHHTNIVPVFGVGQQDGHHYYVMQLIEGQGLDVVLDDVRRLKQPQSLPGESSANPQAQTSDAVTTADVARSLLTGELVGEGARHDNDRTSRPAVAARLQVEPDRRIDSRSSVIQPSARLTSLSDRDRRYHQSIARIGVQVAEALEYANCQGILHRDIKPSNLLLDACGTVWVADFGLAKTTIADDLTHSGDVVGTIRYMAPERFQGHCDARSDIYSLGLTLYEMVALRPAFAARDRHTLIQRVMHEDPSSLRRLAPSVPRDLETIIGKAIARDPGLRYATAGELAADLHRFETDRPIQARRVTSAERLWRWCRHNKLVAAAAGTTAMALVAATVFSILYAAEQTGHAIDQKKANNAITQLNAGLEKEGEQLEAEKNSLQQALAQSNRNRAMLNLERGRAACEQGEIGSGLLWFIASLRAATDAGDPAWQHAACANLAAWRYSQPALLGVFTHFGGVQEVGFSPDGKTISTASREYDWLWNAESGLPIGQPFLHLPRFQGGRLVHGLGLEFAQVDRLVRPRENPGWPFSPDGKSVVTPELDWRLVHLREAATGRVIGEPLARDRQRMSIMTAAYSPDGQMIVTGHLAGTLQRWESSTGNPIGKALEHAGSIDKIAFSPDGKIILSVSSVIQGGTARLWNAATGMPIGLPRRQESMYAFAFSPDGRSLLTAGLNKVALWKIPESETMDAVDQDFVGYPITQSPGGGRALLRGPDFQWRLWDVSTRQAIGKPFKHEQIGGLFSTTFSPDGHRVLTADRIAHKGRLWDADTGKSIGEPMELTAELIAVGFSPDGKTIVTGCADNSFRFWDGMGAKPIGKWLYQSSRISALAFHPTGGVMLAGFSDGTARFWDTATGEPFGPRYPHRGIVTAVAFSSDGTKFLTGSEDNTAYLWRAASTNTAAPLRNEIPATVVSECSPDGELIVVADIANAARLIDVNTGKEVRRMVAHAAPLVSVAFSPDGKKLLTASRDKTARLWNVATGDPIGQPLPHEDQISRVSFSPDGMVALTRQESHIAQLWNVASGQPIGEPLMELSQTHALQFSPDGKTLVTYEWSEKQPPASGAVRAKDEAPKAAARNVAISLASASKLIGARLLDTTTGKPFGKHLQNPGDTTTTTFSPDSKMIVTTNGLRAYRWDVMTGKGIGKLLQNQGRIESVAFSPDGKILLTGELFSPGGKPFVTGEHFGSAHFWETATGKPAGQPLTDKSGFSRAVFSPDGKTILTLSSAAKRARVWDAVTRSPIGQPLDHQAAPWAVAFSPDSKTIVTGCTDNCARLWDSATGQAIGPPLPHRTEVKWVAFSADGQTILTRDAGHIRVWRIAELPDDLPRLSAWVETMTGLELDDEGGIQVLDTPTWNERRKRLAELGGEPVPN